MHPPTVESAVYPAAERATTGAHAGSLVPEAAVSSPDLFGDRAEEYARHRPTYPDALFDHLVTLVERRERAWDCGAGSGQTSRSLAARFAQVIATDASMR